MWESISCIKHPYPSWPRSCTYNPKWKKMKSCMCIIHVKKVTFWNGSDKIFSKKNWLPFALKSTTRRYRLTGWRTSTDREAEPLPDPSLRPGWMFCVLANGRVLRKAKPFSVKRSTFARVLSLSLRWETTLRFASLLMVFTSLIVPEVWIHCNLCRWTTWTKRKPKGF